MPDGDCLPTRLKREGDGLRIDWADGVSTFVTWRALRKACPCATCNDERSKRPSFSSQIAKGTALLEC